MEVAIGSIVRVPLGGRVVRGWVVEVGAATDRPTKPIRRVSGDGPVFTEQLLRTLRWASTHYVAPLAALLRKAGPPNLPRTAKGVELGDVPQSAGRFDGLGAEAASGRLPATLIVGEPRPADIAGTASAVVADGGSAVVIMPTGVEAESLASGIDGWGRRLMLVHPDMSDQQVTSRWTRARDEGGRLIVGTERLALWPVAGLRLAWVVGDGRRGLKARQTPTLQVREVLRRRAATERFSLVVSSLVPTPEMVASGARILAFPGRLWGRVEVVDRGEDPPGSGLLSGRIRSALAAAVKDGRKTFVFTHRHGYAPAFRCVRCRELRVCAVCDARATEVASCTRCGADLGPCRGCAGRRFEPLGAGEGRVMADVARVVGAASVGPVGSDRPVMVGTERDLPTLGLLDLAVIVDADGLMFGTDYRAPESALRTMARVAAAVGSGPRARLLVQTARPSHPLIEALQRGEPMAALRTIIDERRSDGLPPFGQLLVLDVSGPPEWLGERVRALPASALGPMVIGEHTRWLLQAPDLDPAKRELRPLVQELRDLGARVRVDADPIDL